HLEEVTGGVPDGRYCQRGGVERGVYPVGYRKLPGVDGGGHITSLDGDVPRAVPSTNCPQPARDPLADVASRVNVGSMTTHPTMKGPGELLATIPTLLGFEPRESVVVIGMRGAADMGVMMRVDRDDCLIPE